MTDTEILAWRVIPDQWRPSPLIGEICDRLDELEDDD